MKVENIILDNYKTRGKYSLAKKVDMGDFYIIYVSGFQAPKNDKSEIVTNDVGEQTKMIFEEINKVLKLAGASLDDVVKAVVYLTDMNDFNIVSGIRDEYFKNSMPVSTMIEVSRMTRDGAKIEIEVTAIKKK